MKRLAALAFALVACDRGRNVAPALVDAAAMVDAGAVTTASATVATVATLPTVGTQGAPDASTVDACGADLPIASAKSIGHTSVVYKLTLSDGRRLAWKPSAKKAPNRWRGEVAAYRLGLALGLTNVPPACARTYPRAMLADKPVAIDDLTGDPIDGAVIPWIEGLQFLPLEKEPLRTQTAGWLSAKNPPPSGDDAAMAAQISSLVVFDAITGNWDRYSGGNVGLDASGKHVLFIDNDAAFMAGPPATAVKAAEERLEATDRFSKELVARLRTLDEAGLRSALTPDLLPASMIALVATRVRSVLKTIDAKVAARSAKDILVFP